MLAAKYRPDLPACVTLTGSGAEGCLACGLEGFWDPDGWWLLTASVEISELFTVVLSLQRKIGDMAFI